VYNDNDNLFFSQMYPYKTIYFLVKRYTKQTVCLHFVNRVTNYIGYVQNLGWGESEKHGLAVGDAAYYFLRSCSCL